MTHNVDTMYAIFGRSSLRNQEGLKLHPVYSRHTGHLFHQAKHAALHLLVPPEIVLMSQ